MKVNINDHTLPEYVVREALNVTQYTQQKPDPILLDTFFEWWRHARIKLDSQGLFATQFFEKHARNRDIQSMIYISYLRRSIQFGELCLSETVSGSDVGSSDLPKLNSQLNKNPP